MDDGGKDVDGRDGPGHDDSIASASEAIQAVHAGSPFESSESRQRPSPDLRASARKSISPRPRGEI